jgi:hypothetical protein
LLTEVEGRGAKLDQVVTTIEHRLEGPVNDTVIQAEFVDQEAKAQQQVEETRAMLEDFEAELSRLE